MSPSCPERSRGVSTAFLPRAKPRGTPGRAVAVSPLFVAFLPRAKPRGTPNRPLTPLSTAFTQTHRRVGAAFALSRHSPLATVLAPLFSYSCRLFVVRKKLNPFAIKQIHTLSTKHPGWGVSPDGSAAHSAGYADSPRNFGREDLGLRLQAGGRQMPQITSTALSNLEGTRGHDFVARSAAASEN